MDAPPPKAAPPSCSAAILAGGAATRMGGAPKALLEVGGRRILDRLLDLLEPRFAEILLVVKDKSCLPEAFAAYEPRCRIVADAAPDRSSLTGIQTALASASAGHVFVTACDAPLLRPTLLDALLHGFAEQDDVYLPLKPDGYMEPLCAIYSRTCLPHISEQLAHNDYKIIRFFPEVRVRTLPPEELLALDPGLLSFANANTPEDLQHVRELAHAHKD